MPNKKRLSSSEVLGGAEAQVRRFADRGLCGGVELPHGRGIPYIAARQARVFASWEDVLLGGEVNTANSRWVAACKQPTRMTNSFVDM